MYIPKIDDESNSPVKTDQEQSIASLNCDPVSWDTHKENIQPLSQGRKIGALMQALPLVVNHKARQELFEARKNQFDKDLEINCDDANKQLDLWHEYIDWLEQNVPDGGKVNGVTNAIERCIELYHDKKEFKQDGRLLRVFMKFKRFCDEPIEVFGFMYANSICTLLSKFYLNWSWQYESKKNLKRAEDLIKLGLKNLASPREILIEAQQALKARIDRLIQVGELDDYVQSTELSVTESNITLAECGIRKALQTLKLKKRGRVAKAPIRRVAGISSQTTNVGGLKSQMKIVNGVQIPVVKPKPKSTKPIEIFGENDDPSNAPKVPTSQKIALLGKIGSENKVASSQRLG